MGIIKGLRLERYLALLAWLIGGITGSGVDSDHILSAATKGAIPWAFLHQPVIALFFVGLGIASIGGLFISLVLKKEVKNEHTKSGNH